MVWSSLRASPFLMSLGVWVLSTTKPLNLRMVRNIISTTAKNDGSARNDQASSMITALRSCRVLGLMIRFQITPMRADTKGRARSGSSSIPSSSK